jgi:hypothetical protein
VPVPGTELWPTTVPLALGYPTCFLLFFYFGIAVIYIYIYMYIYTHTH